MTIWISSPARTRLGSENANAEGTQGVQMHVEIAGLFGRNAGPYTARNSSKGSLIAETHAIFGALAGGVSGAELRTACLAGKLLRQSASETRYLIWKAVHWRFFAWDPPRWVLDDLARASRSDATAPGFVDLVFLHYARRDRLTFDFVTDKLWDLRLRGAAEVRRDDVLDFLAGSGDIQAARWRESTRKKVAGNMLSALRDFGLLRGVQRKLFQRPVVPADVALHLCRLLYAEGLRGRAVLEATDWRLFLWDVQDTSQALAQLAQRGEIRFERSGRTVVLEVPGHQAGEGW